MGTEKSELALHWSREINKQLTSGDVCEICPMISLSNFLNCCSTKMHRNRRACCGSGLRGIGRVVWEAQDWKSRAGCRTGLTRGIGRRFCSED